MTRCFFLWIAFSVFLLHASAQHRLVCVSDDDDVFEKTELPENFPDAAAAKNALETAITELHARAYLEASLDSLSQSDSLSFAVLHIGPAYKTAFLENGNVNPVFLESAGFRAANFKNKPFNYQQIRQLQTRLLEIHENAGYPFTQIRLDSFFIKKDTLGAKIFADPGNLVTVGKLETQGEVKIAPAFLENYLGIHPGEIFSRSKILNIQNRLRELPFLQESENLRVQFVGDRAEITLFLKKKRASRFDFLIGVLPNNAELGRLLITGSFTGEMHNQFGLGERIFLEFESLRPDTRELQLAFNYPFVFGSPFGADLQFQLYKRDTSYLDVFFDAGVQYTLEGASYLKAFWRQANSSLLSVDSAALVNSRRLPAALDINNTALGLEYALNRLDYRFNPRKGWTLKLRGSAGIKRIERNNKILDLSDPAAPEFDFGSLYDSLALRSFQYRAEVNAAFFVPLLKSQAIKTALQSAFIFADAPVYFNEQYRIGGNRVLRGFDEESVFATNYAVATLEWRLLTGQNSYLFAFGDAAYVQNKTQTIDETDFLYAFGAGLTLDTNVGVFGISYALGAGSRLPLNLRSGKIHFGYVSLF